MGRDGRFISKFNRQGRGPNEYSDLVELAVDFNRGEIYVYSSQLDYKIMVYSLSGEFKRKISIPHPMYVASMKNYDKDNLLVWTTVTPGAQKDMAAKGHFPRYYYVSKNTGEFASLPLMVSEYRDGRLTQNSNGYYRVSGYGAFPITYNGDEIVLSDYACDTIYTLNGGRLSPFIVSVNAKENEDVGVVFKTTRYTVLSVGELGEDVNADHAQKFLGVDHRSGNIFEVEFLNADNGEIVPCDRLSDNYKSLPVETAVTGYSALTLVDQRDAGKLKGRLAEVTATMKEDDNPVLMFIKFKK
jgi:hypothetical protein